jgi:dipeptidyl-peptidase-4
MTRARSLALALPLAAFACGGPPPAVPVASHSASATSATPTPSASVAAPAALPAPTDRAFLHLFVETRFLSLGQPVQVTLTPDARTVLFLRSKAHDHQQSLFELDVASGAVREVLAPNALSKGPERLTLEERARRERMSITASGFTTYELSKDGKTVVVSLSGQLYALDRASGATHAIDVGKDAAIDPRLSPDGKLLAYVQSDDVHVVPVDGSATARALTHGGTQDVTHGLADFAASEELLRYRGYWWSPDSKAILYEEADSTGVQHFTIADPARPESPADRVAYPRTGTKNATIHLGIVRVAAPGATTWIDWDRAKMEYVSRVVWSEGAPPSILVFDRLQKNESMLVVDPKTGKTREVLREHDDAWVTASNFVVDPKVPRWLPDGSAFVWWSERDGDGRYALVSARDPTSMKWLTPRGMQAVSLLDVDAARRVAIVEVTRDGLHFEIASVSLDGGDLTTVAKLDDGAVRGDFDEPHDVFVAHERSLSRPPRTFVRSLDGKTAREVPSVAENPPLPHTEIEDVGPDHVHVALVRPANCVHGAKYPLIDSAYAGPAAARVSLDARGMQFEQWLADSTGAIVVSLDAKGTPGRGRDWERANLNKLGDVPLEGHVQAIQALAATHPEIDAARVGVYGWSFGGYFSALAVLKRPDVYSVGFAIAPGNADWRDYDTAYTERYLGLPDENLAAYRAASLLEAASAPRMPVVRDPLLVIAHGTADDNVYFFNSLKLADAMAKAGRPFTLLPFLGQTHQFASAEALEAVWAKAAETLRLGLSAR